MGNSGDCLTPEEQRRVLAVLWEIRMAAERASVDDPVWLLPNRVKTLADIGMADHRREAQELAAKRRGQQP